MGPDVEGTGALGVVALSGDEEGVALSYTYLSRTVTLELVCDDASTAPAPDEADGSGNAVTIRWLSKEICQGGELSAGTLFCNGFFVLGGLYLFGGTAYNRSQPRGGVRAPPPIVEDVPNIDMWRQLPGLVSAGIQFTITTVSGGGGKADYTDLEQDPLQPGKAHKAIIRCGRHL